MQWISFIVIIVCVTYIIFLVLEDSEDRRIQERMERFSISKNSSRQDKPKINEITQNIIELINPITSVISQKTNQKSLKQLLLEAGFSADDDEVYKLLAKKVVYGLIGLCSALFLVVLGKVNPELKIMLLIICSLTCYRMPDIKLKQIAKLKFIEIVYNLPDVLDLLTVCVEAGLGLDAALVRVSNEMSRTCPVLARELSRTSKDIMSGMSRIDAFRNLSNRNNVPDLKSFVALLIQTDKLGTSIAQSLRVYSDTMRTKRRQRAEKLAAQASVKMVIPLALFILPSMFVVLMAPAALMLIHNFKNLK